MNSLYQVQWCNILQLKVCLPFLILIMFSKNRSDVTHILTELSFKEEVLKTQDLKDLETWKGHILQAQWLAECVKWEWCSEAWFKFSSSPLIFSQISFPCIRNSLLTSFITFSSKESCSRWRVDFSIWLEQIQWMCCRKKSCFGSPKQRYCSEYDLFLNNCFVHKTSKKRDTNLLLWTFLLHLGSPWFIARILGNLSWFQHWRTSRSCLCPSHCCC